MHLLHINSGQIKLGLKKEPEEMVDFSSMQEKVCNGFKIHVLCLSNAKKYELSSGR